MRRPVDQIDWATLTHEDREDAEDPAPVRAARSDEAAHNRAESKAHRRCQPEQRHAQTAIDGQPDVADDRTGVASRSAAHGQGRAHLSGLEANAPARKRKMYMPLWSRTRAQPTWRSVYGANAARNIGLRP